jgi:hypothetical protein
MAASIDLLSGIVAGLRENVSEAPWMAEKTHMISGSWFGTMDFYFPVQL